LAVLGFVSIQFEKLIFWVHLVEDVRRNCNIFTASPPPLHECLCMDNFLHGLIWLHFEYSSWKMPK